MPPPFARRGQIPSPKMGAAISTSWRRRSIAARAYARLKQLWDMSGVRTVIFMEVDAGSVGLRVPGDREKKLASDKGSDRVRSETQPSSNPLFRSSEYAFAKPSWASTVRPQ